MDHTSDRRVEAAPERQADEQGAVPPLLAAPRVIKSRWMDRLVSHAKASPAILMRLGL